MIMIAFTFLMHIANTRHTDDVTVSVITEVEPNPLVLSSIWHSSKFCPGSFVLCPTTRWDKGFLSSHQTSAEPTELAGSE